MKRYSTSLIIRIRKIQIKTTGRYHLVSVRMAKIKDTRKWMKMRRKVSPYALLVRMATGAATTESNTEVSQKIKNKNYHMIQ